MTFSSSRGRRIAAVALRLLLAAVFLVAAWTKLRQPWAMFALSIDAYGILPEPAVVFVARTLPWAELALGLLLLTGAFPRFSTAAAAAILFFFFIVLVRSYVKGLQIDCGCFGFGEALSARTLARDALLLLAALAAAALYWARGAPGAPLRDRRSARTHRRLACVLALFAPPNGRPQQCAFRNLRPKTRNVLSLG
jgi:uncharacterized membrane protein YphA (DoxX/SURF4 family)